MFKNITRKKIYNIIEVAASSDEQSRKQSATYDSFMIVMIILSLVPLAFKIETPVLKLIDHFTVAVFVIDYILRLMTADFKMKDKSLAAFVKYPFTPMAIIDLLSIVPSMLLTYQGWKVLRILRLLRALRVFRIFRTIRYSKNIVIILNVFRRQKMPLMTVVFITAGYIIATAMLAFQTEPDTFNSFFEAVYWAVISMTTIGYGDIYLTTPLGQFITVLSAIMGIFVVALPAGIITAGYMEEMEDLGELHYPVNTPEKLRELKSLYEEGLISEADYERKKNEILDKE